MNLQLQIDEDLGPNSTMIAMFSCGSRWTQPLFIGWLLDLREECGNKDEK